MDCTGKDKGQERHPCEAPHCMTPRARTMYDRVLKRWLFDLCWVKTPIPPPRPKRP